MSEKVAVMISEQKLEELFSTFEMYVDIIDSSVTCFQLLMDMFLERNDVT